MSLKNWNELTMGGVNLEPGSSLKNFTASYRSGQKPVFNPDNCINCFFLLGFLPGKCYNSRPGKNYRYKL